MRKSGWNVERISRAKKVHLVGIEFFDECEPVGVDSGCRNITSSPHFPNALTRTLEQEYVILIEVGPDAGTVCRIAHHDVIKSPCG